MTNTRTPIVAVFFLITLFSTASAALTDQQLLDLDAYIELLHFTPSSQLWLDPANAIQAAFHDCTQGCDGSIDISADPNKRLARYVHRLEKGYQRSGFQGRADFSKGDYAVYTQTKAVGKVLKKASLGGSGNDAPVQLADGEVLFKYGRPAHTGAYDADDNEGPFSTGLEAWDDLYETFQMCTKGVFTDDDENQLVALLGAHQIGRAKQKFSGFQGRWRPCGVKNSLTNGLFKAITGLGKPNLDWIQTHAS